MDTGTGAVGQRGNLAATAEVNGTVSIHDAHAPTLFVSQSHSGPVRSLAFSPDDPILASAGDDGTVRLGDVANRSPRNTIRGHTQEITQVVFAPDGGTVVSAWRDATVKAWPADLPQGRRTLAIALRPSGPLAYAPTVYADSSGRRVRRCNRNSSSQAARSTLPRTLPVFLRP